MTLDVTGTQLLETSARRATPLFLFLEEARQERDTDKDNSIHVEDSLKEDVKTLLQCFTLDDANLSKTGLKPKSHHSKQMKPSQKGRCQPIQPQSPRSPLGNKRGRGDKKQPQKQKHPRSPLHDKHGRGSNSTTSEPQNDSSNGGGGDGVVLVARAASIAG